MELGNDGTVFVGTMGDDVPDCELDCCRDATPPDAKLGPHVAPLAIEFYTGTQLSDDAADRIYRISYAAPATGR